MISSRFRRQVKYSLTKQCWNFFIHLWRINVCRKNTVRVAPQTDRDHVSSVASG